MSVQIKSFNPGELELSRIESSFAHRVEGYTAVWGSVVDHVYIPQVNCRTNNHAMKTDGEDRTSTCVVLLLSLKL